MCPGQLTIRWCAGLMPTIELIGRITEEGLLDVQLPNGLPAGQVVIRIDVAEPMSISAPIQAESQPANPGSTAIPEQSSKPAKSERNSLVEWLRDQQRRAARQKASATDYRLKWVRYMTQMRKKTYRRSLNREK